MSEPRAEILSPRSGRRTSSHPNLRLASVLTTGPVSRILSPSRKAGRGTVIPLGPTSRWGSSDLPGSWTRRAGPCPDVPGLLPYLVLLRVGFALPRALLPGRCALTAPFHPYPDESGRYVFCGTFRRSALEGEPPGCYPAHCSMEFGLSSPVARCFAEANVRAARATVRSACHLGLYATEPRRAFSPVWADPALPAWFPHIPLYPASQPIGVPAF